MVPAALGIKSRDMRSIAPGNELLHEFTAGYAGVWMHHCDTAPALQHIANGVFGMVIVEPAAGPPPVDKEFAMVQDTVTREGVHLVPGNDGSGGSQAVDLSSARGGDHRADANGRRPLFDGHGRVQPHLSWRPGPVAGRGWRPDELTG
jgi:hypothetical protein